MFLSQKRRAWSCYEGSSLLRQCSTQWGWFLQGIYLFCFLLNSSFSILLQHHCKTIYFDIFLEEVKILHFSLTLTWNIFYRSGPSSITSTKTVANGLETNNTSAWMKWWFPTLKDIPLSSTLEESPSDMATRFKFNFYCTLYFTLYNVLYNVQCTMYCTL